MNELDRLLINDIGKLPETGLIITIKHDVSEASVKKILDLITSVISVEKVSDQSDEIWEKYLPDWFILKAKNVSEVELIENEQIWHFGSWVDAIKQRGWKWWWYKKTEDKTLICLETTSYPYNIDPFIYVLYNLGIDFESIEILEIYPNSRTLKIVK